MDTQYAPPRVNTEKGRELLDIILLAKSLDMSSQSIEAAFLGHIGVNASCWRWYLCSRVATIKNSSTPERG